MEVCTFGFLMLWASSRIMRAQDTRRRGADVSLSYLAYLHTSESLPGSAGAPESHQRPDDGENRKKFTVTALKKKQQKKNKYKRGKDYFCFE
uniref:Secreted protein n=1 Tax=Neolamprologus brichardi TaxID=32507 RepID=A0A3Q4H647_NEOBR